MVTAFYISIHMCTIHMMKSKHLIIRLLFPVFMATNNSTIKAKGEVEALLFLSS